MEKKFFRLVTNAYDNVGGLLYAPKGVYRLAVDGEPVKNWENIIMKLMMQNIKLSLLMMRLEF